MSDEPALELGLGDDLPPDQVVSRAFGELNRAKLLHEYFSGVEAVTAGSAWRDVYHLLLWIDRTTGLAHCYESDKCQPGRPWYARSLVFHDWLAGEFGVQPGDVADAIDWLFRRASADLAQAAVRAKRSARVEQQRSPYEGRGFPEPGQDPELESIIVEGLSGLLTAEPDSTTLRRLTERIQAHLTQENKRKNLVGEGFEDTLAEVLRRVPGVADRWHIRARPLLSSLPGFNPARANQKPRKVDLALIRRSDDYRVLITAKWSVRSDREEQFHSDFSDYAQYEAKGEDFGYVLITNEFDPARLNRACTMRRENALLFSQVVHVNPAAPICVYGSDLRGTPAEVLAHVESGRLMSLQDCLAGLAS